MRYDTGDEERTIPEEDYDFFKFEKYSKTQYIKESRFSNQITLNPRDSEEIINEVKNV